MAGARARVLCLVSCVLTYVLHDGGWVEILPSRLLCRKVRGGKEGSKERTKQTRKGRRKRKRKGRREGRGRCPEMQRQGRRDPHVKFSWPAQTVAKLVLHGKVSSKKGGRFRGQRGAAGQSQWGRAGISGPVLLDYNKGVVHPLAPAGVHWALEGFQWYYGLLVQYTTGAHSHGLGFFLQAAAVSFSQQGSEASPCNSGAGS